MLWLDELWPEDAFSLYDIKNTAVPLAVTGPTLIAGGNPQRVGLIISTGTTATAVSIAPDRTVAVGKGISVVGPNFTNVFVGPGFEILAAQAWFGVQAGGGPGWSIIEIILNRPAVRPARPATVVEIPAIVNHNDALAKMLKKQQKWRKKVYQELQKRGYTSGQQTGAFAGLAGLVPGGLRQPKGGLSALPAAQQFLFRPERNGPARG